MILTVIIIYLLGMLGIGFWASKKIQNDEDYLMGGFKFGLLPMTGTYLATYFSALSLLGGVGLIYRIGVGGPLSVPFWQFASEEFALSARPNFSTNATAAAVYKYSAQAPP